MHIHVSIPLNSLPVQAAYSIDQSSLTIQQVLVGYPFQIQPCAHVYPKLPILSPHPPPAAISSFSRSMCLLLFCK